MKTVILMVSLILTMSPLLLQAQTILIGNRIDTVCSATFYDTGGPTGNYGNNENFVHTFYPPSGSRLTISFSGIFNINSSDVLVIYNGNSVNAPVLGTYSSSFRPPMFTSTAADGSLTFRFISDGSFSGRGWTGNISCCTAPFPSTASSSAANVCSGEPFTLSMSRYCGNLQWQVSTDSVVWNDLDTLNPYPSLTTTQSRTSYYRGKVSLNDSTLYSNVLLVTTDCYRMGLSTHDTLCSGVSYDDAGPGALYSNNQNAIQTFHPLPGNKLTVSFRTNNNFNLRVSDTLTIYDGNSTTAPILAKLNGPFAPTAPFTSTAADGSLTFQFVSDANFASEGWAADFSCICDSNQINNLSHAPIAPICDNSTLILLSGASLSGGTYTGMGVVNGRFFDPSLTGAGTFLLTYNFTAASGCTASTTVTVQVVNTYQITTNASICQGDAYAWNGAVYTTAGTYTDSLLSVNGCDSIAILNLSVRALPNRDTTRATICPGTVYNWNGMSYSTAGFYTDTLVASNGCDSLATLDLSLYASPRRDTSQVIICQGDTYNWRGGFYTMSGSYSDTLINANGCDSIVTLDLQVQALPNRDTTQASICQGDSYTWRGSSYSTTGLYTDTLVAANGCDSLTTLNLQVNPLPNVQMIGLDSVYCDTNAVILLMGTPVGGTFSGNGVSGNQFNPANAPLGNTTITYTYTGPNGCTNTATTTTRINDCNVISVQRMPMTTIQVYPNPSTGWVTVQQSSTAAMLVEVFAPNGRRVVAQTTTADHHRLNLQEQPSGIYFMRITTATNTYSQKVVLIK